MAVCSGGGPLCSVHGFILSHERSIGLGSGGIWRPGQSLGLLVMFLYGIFGVAGDPTIGNAIAIGSSLGPLQCFTVLHWWYLSN